MKKLKKISLVSAILCISVFAAIFTSCASTSKYSITTKSNELRSDNLVINTMIEKDDYKIIGKVTGESNFVYYDSAKVEFIGDTFCYGKLNTADTVTVSKGLAVGVSSSPMLKGFSPVTSTQKISATEIAALEVAKQNAIYDLIQNAFAINADSVVEPIFTVEKHVEEEYNKDKNISQTSYKVTVRAIAIQLKTN